MKVTQNYTFYVAESAVELLTTKQFNGVQLDCYKAELSSVLVSQGCECSRFGLSAHERAMGSAGDKRS